MAGEMGNPGEMFPTNAGENNGKTRGGSRAKHLPASPDVPHMAQRRSSARIERAESRLAHSPEGIPHNSLRDPPPLGLDPSDVASLSRESLRGLWQTLHALEAAVLERLLASAPPRAPEADLADRLLTVAEVAGRLAMSKHAVYRRAARWSFTRKSGWRTLRFSERGLDKAIATGHGL
jgi:hypothetical protein